MRAVLSAIFASTFLASIPAPTLAQEAGQSVFRVPLENVKPGTTVDPVFVWMENVSSCSTTCGTGTRTTSYQCQDVTQPDLISGGFGSAEPDGQCTASGAKPANSTSACTNFSGCSFDWVKPPEVVTVIPVGSNPPGRPGCGQVQRAFDPSCRRNDGTAMADSDHAFCRNDRPDYNDVAAGIPDALGYDRTAIELGSCNTTDHEWVTAPWGAWSSTCSNTAIHTRSVTCKRKFDGALVADAECPTPKPATSETQGVYSSCSYAAEFGAWAAWSSECSTSSNRTRTVQCRRSNGDIVPNTVCSANGVTMTPVSETSARYGSCTYSRDNPGAWTSWSSTCSSSATRSRTYECRRSNGDIVANSECTSRGINLSESENGAQYGGCSYSANFGAWGSWSSTCSSSAFRTRSATCRRSDGSTVSNSECTSRGISLTPTTESSAQYGGCSYSTAFGAWSGWSSSCSASATRSRSATCVRSDGTAVAASECTGRGVSMTPTSESSAQYGGCSYSASFGAWSGWSSGCSASATRTRSATCLRSDGSAVASTECTNRGIAMTPTSETSAQYGSCGYSANFGAWSGWSSSCSSNAIRTRAASCRRSDGSIVADGECTSRGIALTPTSEASAQYSGCGYSANFGGWSGWSSSCSASAFRTRSVTCQRSDGAIVANSECTNRGIAVTPTSESSAQYGGCSYTPSYGSWSSCNSGSQTRTVTCTRSDGTQVAASNCGVTAPGGVQSQACTNPVPTFSGYFYNADAYVNLSGAFNRPAANPSFHEQTDGNAGIDLGNGNGNYDYAGFNCGYYVTITYGGQSGSASSMGYTSENGSCIAGLSTVTIGGRTFNVSGSFSGMGNGTATYIFRMF